VRATCVSPAVAAYWTVRRSLWQSCGWRACGRNCSSMVTSGLPSRRLYIESNRSRSVLARTSPVVHQNAYSKPQYLQSGISAPNRVFVPPGGRRRSAAGRDHPFLLRNGGRPGPPASAACLADPQPGAARRRRPARARGRRLAALRLASISTDTRYSEPGRLQSGLGRPNAYDRGRPAARLWHAGGQPGLWLGTAACTSDHDPTGAAANDGQPSLTITIPRQRPAPADPTPM